MGKSLICGCLGGFCESWAEKMLVIAVVALNDCVFGCGERSVGILWGHLLVLYTLLDFNNRVPSEMSGRIG